MEVTCRGCWRGGCSSPTGGDAGRRSGPAVEGSRAPGGRRAAAGVPDRREERTALDPGGAGLLFAGLPADRPGRLGAGFPAGSAAGRPIRAPRELPPPPALPPRALGWAHLAGSVPIQEPEVVSVEAV